MAFSIFGKRPTEPDQSNPPEPQEPKRGLFDRMKQAVTRTRESFTESISSVIALTREVDETTLVNLEPLLLAASEIVTPVLPQCKVRLADALFNRCSRAIGRFANAIRWRQPV